MPDGHTEESYLRELVYEGAKQRYGAMLPEEVTDRIEHELRIILEMGFPAYFLIVWDLIRYARGKQYSNRTRAVVRRPVRSWRTAWRSPTSIRSSYGLIFERFLNPGRRQMPDIDMDFDERYRADVIKYASEKYGSDHVAQIITFSTIKGRQAIRDAARVLGLPLWRRRQGGQDDAAGDSRTRRLAWHSASSLRQATPTPTSRTSTRTPRSFAPPTRPNPT